MVRVQRIPRSVNSRRPPRAATFASISVRAFESSIVEANGGARSEGAIFLGTLRAAVNIAKALRAVESLIGAGDGVRKKGNHLSANALDSRIHRSVSNHRSACRKWPAAKLEFNLYTLRRIASRRPYGTRRRSKNRPPPRPNLHIFVSGTVTVMAPSIAGNDSYQKIISSAIRSGREMRNNKCFDYCRDN